MGKTYRRDNEQSSKWIKDVAKRKNIREKEEVRWRENIPDSKKNRNDNS